MTPRSGYTPGMPIRSRHGLTRCPRCRAHVRAPDRPRDLRCPFCAPPRSAGAGRAGVLAASLLGFSTVGTACGGDGPLGDLWREADDSVEVDVYGMPPEMQDDPPVTPPEEEATEPEPEPEQPVEGPAVPTEE